MFGFFDRLFGIRSTFTGSVNQNFHALNRLLWFMCGFTGLWVPMIFAFPFSIALHLDQHFAQSYKQYEIPVLIVTYSIALFIFYRNLRRLYEHNPLSGENIPDFMVSTCRDNSGFFFGTVTKQTFLSSQKYYISKPIDKDGHILIVGGAGSYKTSAIAIPTLETWNGLIFAIDVKVNGNLLEQWQRLNANTGKSVKVFNPLKDDCCAYDPYSLLRDGGEDNLIHNARELTLSVLHLPPEVKDPIWIKSAQNLLTACILHYFNLGKTFSETMEAIQITPMVELMRELIEGDFVPAQMYISKLHGLELKQLVGVGMELTHLILFAIDPRIKKAFDITDKADTIDWGEWSSLKNDEPLYDIIWQVPEDKLEQWENMLTLTLNQLIRTLERRAEKHSTDGVNLPPILIMLDEFPRLGKVKAIQGALATLRSRGVTICLIVQSLAQLDEIYGVHARRGIIDNCPYKAILNATDADSQAYFSKIVGTAEIEKESRSASINSETGLESSTSSSWSKKREPIIHPHEFASLDDIVLMTPRGCCRVDKAPYYLEPEYIMATTGVYVPDTPIQKNLAVHILIHLGKIIFAPIFYNSKRRKFTDAEYGYIFLFLQSSGFDLPLIGRVYSAMRNIPVEDSSPLHVCLIKTLAKTKNPISIEMIEKSLDAVKEEYTAKQAEDFFYRCCHTRFKEIKSE